MAKQQQVLVSWQAQGRINGKALKASFTTMCIVSKGSY